jgi:hypothetical protein
MNFTLNPYIGDKTMITRHNQSTTVKTDNYPSLHKTILQILLIGGIGVLTSCGGDDGNNDGGDNTDGGGYNPASCGKLMSTNLNENVAGSLCYINDPENCDKYGRLYDWVTAMALPEKCNATLSTSDPECSIQSKHQGICPDGWHIPNKDELEQYGSYECLKNQAGGFKRNMSGYFSNAGSDGCWWSSTEFSNGFAYYRIMSYDDSPNYYNGEHVRNDNYYKNYMHSVRCVEN